MLQAIISPAKQMRIDADAFAPRGIPPFPIKTRRLIEALRAIEREQGPAGLKTLWNVNETLLVENVERLHEFEPVMDEVELDDLAVSRLVGPAVFSYVGIQYRSMAPDVLDLDALDWLQEHLWVLSGLYGCARPFDAVQPYRLEMGARLSVDGARDLYRFWGAKIANAIEADAQANGEHATVVNLASMEYAKAVLPLLSPKTTIVTCIFGEGIRNGKPVQRATASKIARGSMVRWMAERGIEDAGGLAAFDIGYTYAPEFSTTSPGARERTLVFMKR